ncbi:MAG: PAS domain S-box protein, partial [Deltaproteobacteria bacterium]|nr:PAS domain S-box protein [Deltaproteobacteria bacterium]
MAEKPSYEELEKRVQELEQPKAALCESEGQFKSLVSNIPGIIYRCKFDKAWTMLYINAEVERISGYPSSHFINNSVRTYESIIHRDDTAFVDKSVTDCIKTNQNWDIQYRIIHKDGRAQWVHEKGYAIVDDTGAVQYLDGFIIDIHELHNVRIEKERTAMELTQLIDTANAPIFGVDVEGKINEWNQMVARITGYDKDEVEGKNLVKGYISEE